MTFFLKAWAVKWITLLSWCVRPGSEWIPVLSACQTHPKSLGDKGAVPLTFSEMPCMTTSKSDSKSVLSASCSKKPFFPFKGSMSDKTESSQDILASQTSELRAPLFLHANSARVTPLSVCLSASLWDYEIQQGDSHLNNCFQMSFLISRSHYLPFCTLAGNERRDC